MTILKKEQEASVAATQMSQTLAEPDTTLTPQEETQTNATKMSTRLSTSGDLVDLEFKKLNKKTVTSKKNKTLLEATQRIVESESENTEALEIDKPESPPPPPPPATKTASKITITRVTGAEASLLTDNLTKLVEQVALDPKLLSSACVRIEKINDKLAKTRPTSERPNKKESTTAPTRSKSLNTDSSDEQETTINGQESEKKSGKKQLARKSKKRSITENIIEIVQIVNETSDDDGEAIATRSSRSKARRSKSRLIAWLNLY